MDRRSIGPNSTESHEQRPHTSHCPNQRHPDAHRGSRRRPIGPAAPRVSRRLVLVAPPAAGAGGSRLSRSCARPARLRPDRSPGRNPPLLDVPSRRRRRRTDQRVGRNDSCRGRARLGRQRGLEHIPVPARPGAGVAALSVPSGRGLRGPLSTFTATPWVLGSISSISRSPASPSGSSRKTSAAP